MKKSLVVVLLAVWGCGCAPDWYRRDADLQVSQIVKEREKQTLAYAPDVVVKDLPTPAAPRHPYEKVPATPVPTQTKHILEPANFDVPWGKYGPDNVFPGLQPTTMPAYFDINAFAPSAQLRLGPAAPAPAPIKLDLFHSLEFATQHSRDYQNQMENLYLAALDVTLQRHLFYEPQPFVTQSIGFDGGQQDVKYRSALTATTSVGAKQKLPFGGEVAASGLVNFVDALNSNTADGQNAQVALSATIPFLRGAGWVNLEPLLSSERQLVYAVRTFETYRRSFLVNIATSYFNLVTQQRGLANLVESVDNSHQLTERSEALYRDGRLKFVDVQRSLLNEISAQGSLVSAQESYQASLDNFKITLGLDPQAPADIIPIELETNIPRLAMDDAIKLALEYRLDLQTARDQIDDAQRQVEIGKNGLLPDLGLALNSAVGTPLGSSAFNSQTTTYDATLTLGLPVDRVAERNAYRRALINLQRAQRSFETQRDTVIVDARNALRRIQSAEENLDLQGRGIDVARAQLAYSTELLRQGVIDNRDVVDANNALLSAQDAYDQARADLQIQVLAYFRDTGTLRVDPAAGALGRALQYSDPDVDKTLREVQSTK